MMVASLQRTIALCRNGRVTRLPKRVQERARARIVRLLDQFSE
jgi:hypothetical protein